MNRAQVNGMQRCNDARTNDERLRNVHLAYT